MSLINNGKNDRCPIWRNKNVSRMKITMSKFDSHIVWQVTMAGIRVSAYQAAEPNVVERTSREIGEQRQRGLFAVSL